jgi:hypothetical protein
MIEFLDECFLKTYSGIGDFAVNIKDKFTFLLGLPFMWEM